MARTILVVEDDEPSRRVLGAALSRAGFDVVALASGVDALRTVERAHFDLAILDLRLADGPGGLEIARVIRAHTDVPIMFLSAVEALDERLAAFDMGGEDFIIKPVSLAELLARIDAVLRRTTQTREPNELKVDDLVIDVTGKTVSRSGELVRLTKTEMVLLTELVRRQGRVVSKRELLSRVWGYSEFDDNVVEVAVSALRKKLEAHGPRLIHTVRGAGYIVRD